MDDRWTGWYEGVTVTWEDNGENLLAGLGINQAALHSLLRKVRDLGLLLISVNRIEPNQPAVPDVKHRVNMVRQRRRTMTINSSLQPMEKLTSTSNASSKSGINSPKRLARIAGLLYLIVGIFGGFSIAYVTARVYAPGDATTTAANVLANAGLVRIGVVADLIQATVLVFLAMTLYLLLKHVNKNVARAMVVLVAIAATIMCLNNVFQFAALLVATNESYMTAFGVEGSSALVLLLLDIHHYGFLIAQIFFGLWLAPLGYLAYKSGMFPKVLGIVLIMACVSYLVDMLTAFLAPNFNRAIHGFLAIPPTIAEIWMLGYLLVKGVKIPAHDTSTASAGETSRVAGEVFP